MRTTQELWFEISTVFREAHRLSLSACASEIVSLRRESRAAGRGTTVHMQISGRFLEAGKLADSKGFEGSAESKMDIPRLREELRKRLKHLEAELTGALAENDKYHVLFGIVIFCDEMINEATQNMSAKWESLQSEFFGIDNGGELFYTKVDELLRRPETPPLVFEVFYYCLKDGFAGRYDRESPETKGVMAQLAEKIPVRLGDDLEPEGTASVELVYVPWRNYVYSAVAVALTFVALQSAASCEVDLESPRSAKAVRAAARAASPADDPGSENERAEPGGE